MAKYKGKYRIESSRLQNWDYGWDGAYFITICTKDRAHYFGDINNGIMHLSPVGAIANVLWYEIKNHASNLTLGEFVVMPNHVHGILILDGNDGVREKAGLVSTSSPSEIEPPQTIGQKRFQNQGKNTISSIVGGYKSAVTRHSRRLGFDFAWQARFWDHVIRDENAYERISQYIKNNTIKWQDDKLNGGKGNVVLDPGVPYGEEY
ncbi:MAG: transposase [Bacteroidota bacterium]